MPYTPRQAPGNLPDFDALRAWVEEEFMALASQWAEDDLTSASDLTTVQNSITALQNDITALQAADTALDARLDKLEGNQFARVYLDGANQTGLASASYTKINFNTVEFDPSGIWDNTNKQFKPTIAGYYRVSWNVFLQAAGGAFVYLADLNKNGTRIARGASTVLTTVNINGIVSGSTITHVNGTSDVLDIRAYIEGTASRDVIWGIDNTAFMISLVKAD